MGSSSGSLSNRILLWLLLPLGATAAACAGKTEYHAHMTGEELRQRMDAGSAPLVVDVRSGREYRAGHVPGAVHLPFQQAFFKHDQLPHSPDAAVVLYCEHGPRAYIARLGLQLAGFERLMLLRGHMSRWRKNGYPVEH